MSMRNSGSVRSVRETGTGGKVRPVVSREGADGFFRTVPAVGEGPSCRLLRTVAKLRENAYLPVGMTTLGYLSEIFRLFYPDFRLIPGIHFRGNCYKCGDRTEHPHFLAWNPVHTPTPDFHRPEFLGEMILS